MPKTFTRERAAALAAEYIINKFDKGKALRAVGYSDRYSKSGRGLALFERDIFKEEQDKIAKRNAEAVDVTVSEIIGGLKKKAFPKEGEKVKDSDNIAALAHLAKYKNMFTDRLIIGEDKMAMEMTERERNEAERVAMLRLKEGSIGEPLSEDEQRELVRLAESVLSRKNVDSVEVEPPSSLN